MKKPPLLAIYVVAIMKGVGKLIDLNSIKPATLDFIAVYLELFLFMSQAL
jgi:hypothetical protein